MNPGDLTVQRIASTAAAMFGLLSDDTHAQIGVITERPWLQNATDVSCIPAGTYRWRKSMSDELGYVTPEMLGVPDRDGIRIHIGCIAVRDSKGCLLVGTAFGHVDYDDGKPNASGDGVTASHAAFARLMNLLKDTDSGTITILDPPDGPDTTTAMADAA